ARLARALPMETQRARVEDVLGGLARDHRYAQVWREEVPFTDLETLRDTCAPHAEPVAEWDPTRDPEGAEEMAAQVAAFVRRQARSLRVALNYSGHEAADRTGMSEVLRGEAIVPPQVVEGVRRRLADEGAGGRGGIPGRRGLEADRAYYVVATGDIAEAAVASLGRGSEVEEAGGAEEGELRFEVERGGAGAAEGAGSGTEASAEKDSSTSTRAEPDTGAGAERGSSEPAGTGMEEASVVAAAGSARGDREPEAGAGAERASSEPAGTGTGMVTGTGSASGTGTGSGGESDGA
ncbi:MAG TPA: hypothetical protein RMH80_05240, partial [Polyangiaceae bacterium LLY-WYZ-15_(1-7)]|nr:hypothetical protein [Polyangiaceae bacterium LLY-WYZ-15_(1-7)]